MTTPLSQLEQTVEAVRAARFPKLPAELVEAILKIENECVENRSEVERRESTAIQAFLDSHKA